MDSLHHGIGRLMAAAVTLALLVLSGCQLMPQRTTWREADVVNPQLVARPFLPATTAEMALADAQERYAEATALENQGDSRCVDCYFQVAQQTWTFALATDDLRPTAHSEAFDLHYSALIQTIVSAQQFGRWNPQTGLTIMHDGAAHLVPVQYRGFVWLPSDFHELIPAGAYASTQLTESLGSDGVGVPLVVVRYRPAGQEFIPPRAAFAATVVLKPNTAVAAGGPSTMVLELSDPLRTNTTEIDGVSVPLTRDLTAPIAYQLGTTPRTWWTDFVNAGTTTGNEGLYMLEPYQPGKVPVIFIHGLLSDRMTWAQMLNDLRALPDIANRYQFLAFEYATGRPFLEAAAQLRTELHVLRESIDPGHVDAALQQTVLVGHSMGGLVARLQISQSNDILWHSIANRPFDAIRATSAHRHELATNFFFLPSPNVSRVVFIGTPHRGSSDAQRATARVLSSFVEPTPEQLSLHDQLVRDNPGAFLPQLESGVPTSVDMLDPDSPILQGIWRLPINAQVRLHSIIGDARWSVSSGPGDGVVSVSSAEFPGVESQRFVPALHTLLTSDPEVIDEVIRILRSHGSTSASYLAR